MLNGVRYKWNKKKIPKYIDMFYCRDELKKCRPFESWIETVWNCVNYIHTIIIINMIKKCTFVEIVNKLKTYEIWLKFVI